MGLDHPHHRHLRSPGGRLAWRGRLFGRVMGIFAAALAAIAALLAIPAYPFWSLAISRSPS